MDYKMYLDEVCEDMEDVIKDGGLIQEYKDDEDKGYNEFVDDYQAYQMMVTGNDNGSYYCNYVRAQEALEDVIWDDDARNMLWNHELDDLFYGYIKENNPEAADVIMREACAEEVFNDVQEWFEEQIHRELD